MAMHEDDVSAAPERLKRAWGLERRPTKGPKPGLSVERIVTAGVRLAEADGLAAVSMGSVAAEIDSSAMSLYRYVASKDELLALMGDFAIGVPPQVVDADQKWRPGLEQWAETRRARWRRFPWALSIPAAGPPVMPNEIGWLETGLRCLRSTALSEQEKLSTMLLLGGFVRAEAMLTADEPALGGGDARYGSLVASLTEPAAFPALHAALDAGALDFDDDPDGEFIFGLDRILDGIDVLIRIRTGMSMAERA